MKRIKKAILKKLWWACDGSSSPAYAVWFPGTEIKVTVHPFGRGYSAELPSNPYHIIGHDLPYFTHISRDQFDYVKEIA